MLPLALTSLSQRIDLVRVSEIADYSTYYQPVVMRDIYGFGKPMDDVAMLWQPGILTTAWGPVVRQIAAGLDLTLDPELEEIVERVPADARPRARSASTSPRAPWAPCGSRSSARSTACRG